MATTPAAKKKKAPRRNTGTIIGDDKVSVNGATGEESAEERRRTVLAVTVDQQIREAVTARENSGIEEIWAEDDDQYNGVDDQSAPYSMVKTRDQVPRDKRDKRSKVFVPITKPKTDIGVARVSEMLLPNDDKPWAIEPTPVPDIDEALNAPESEMVTLSDGAQVPSRIAAQFLKDKASAYAEAESDWIEDKFAEGEVYSEMRQCLRDAGRIGTGVIKGPMPIQRVAQKWSVTRQPSPASEVPTDQVATVANYPQVIHRQAPPEMSVKSVLKRIESIEPTSKCVRVQDCYPDPACGDNIHDGAFFVERAFLTGKELKKLAFLPGYDQRCIVDCLREGPLSYQSRRDQRTRMVIGDTFSDSKLFEVYYYYGDASPDDLELIMERGNPLPGSEPKPNEDDDEYEAKNPLDDLLSEEDRRYLATVPVVFTMVNGRPIKATLNPMETGGFPYDFFPWEPVKGQPYGRGIPRKMAVAQRMLNAAVRALLENAGLSAGPQIVTMRGAITPWNGSMEFTGRKGWYFDPQESGIDDVRKAFAVVEVPSVQQELSAIIQLALDFADQLTNLPMLMQGDQQANTSPETLGGLKMLFNNAMSPLRVIAKLFDDRLIVPHLKRYHDWAMEKGPDKIKGGDSQIVAKGSTALIQREEGREFLSQVFPVSDDPKLKIDKAKLITEMARSNGFDMSTVQYTDEEWKKLQEEAAKNPPPQDPAIEAAQIRSKALVEAAQIGSQSQAAGLAAKQHMAELQQAHEAAMADVDREIAQMELSGKRSDALMALKARLAESAMNVRQKGEEMSLKLDPANRSGLGI